MPLRLALWQGNSPQGDAEAGLAALQTALMAAGAAGAAMLVAPEVWLPGYNQPDIPARAQAQAGGWVAALSAVCARAGCGLCVGYAERDGDHIFNAAMVFDAAGVMIAHYRKIQLFGPREKAIYAPGDGYAIFDLMDVRTAVLICYDIEFAPHVAALAAKGVKLILCPTANMEPFTHVVRATVPAMAANHALAIAYANFCGTEGELTYVGGSLIAAADGSVVAQAGRTPALIIADLPEVEAAHLATQAADYRSIG
jgi:5-aminopentanamidase